MKQTARRLPAADLPQSLFVAAPQLPTFSPSSSLLLPLAAALVPFLAQSSVLRGEQPLLPPILVQVGVGAPTWLSFVALPAAQRLPCSPFPP